MTKVEIYKDAVLINGQEVTVLAGGIRANKYDNPNEVTTITVEMIPETITIHGGAYKANQLRNRIKGV